MTSLSIIISFKHVILINREIIDLKHVKLYDNYLNLDDQRLICISTEPSLKRFKGANYTYKIFI